MKQVNVQPDDLILIHAEHEADNLQFRAQTLLDLFTVDNPRGYADALNDLLYYTATLQQAVIEKRYQENDFAAGSRERMLFYVLKLSRSLREMYEN